MLSDPYSALYTHPAVLDALPVIGVGPKVVLLGQRLTGVHPAEDRIQVVLEGLNRMEEVKDARGF